MTSFLGSRVWTNGAVVDATQVIIPISDRGFTLGDGLFETMFWTGAEVRFFADHMARLVSSAVELDIAWPFSTDDLEAGLIALAQDANGGPAVLRVTLTRGNGPRGLGISDVVGPLLIASIAPVSATLAPVSVATVAITRHAGAPSARFKTMSYIDNIMALHQARNAGADDAVLRGTTGNVACASSANLVVRFKGATLTPALQDGALPGIVRGRLIQAGLVEEACISPLQLVSCDAGALTNAIIGVRAIDRIDGRVIAVSSDWTQPMADALR